MTGIIFTVFAAMVLIPVAVIATVYMLVPFFTAVGWTIRHIARFIGGEIGDLFRIVGAIITATVLGALVILNIVIGRWSAAAHFGTAVQTELAAMGAALYRVLIGHPARFLLLHSLTEGLERRLPAAMACAPGADHPAAKRSPRSMSVRFDGDGITVTRAAPRTGRASQFEGYTIVASLPGGGSGGKLYIAEPDAIKQAAFARAGHVDVGQVVIKTFSLHDGSSLPQIVRESRSLDAAKRLGLVLDHELTDDRFFYVMRYIRGDSLGLVTQRLHAVSDQSLGEGLDERNLRAALSYCGDLLGTLDQYHRGGLWHKDVKPDNIIVDGRAAHLVDFGLLTPLRSAMTLTTHGTEYFRDPEMVRMALKGVKVHQVDGARFDIYAAGAVLYSMIENSFPAHGGLSQISKRCPEALRWIVRRAMADYDKRYTSAAAMLADLDVVQRATDPFAVKPAQLPSMRGIEAGQVDASQDEAPIRPAASPVSVGAGSDAAGPDTGSQSPRAGFGEGGSRGADHLPPRGRPRIRVNRWWSGGYVVDDNKNQADVRRTPFVQRSRGIPAHEQLRSARSRAAAARERAQQRIAHRRNRQGEYNTFNTGTSAAVLVFMAAFLLVAAFMVMVGRTKSPHVRIVNIDSEAPLLYAQGLLPDAAAQALIAPGSSQPTSVRASRPDRPVPRIVVDDASPSPTAAELAAVAEGRRVLVVSDVQPPTQPVISALGRMATTGFVLLGNYPGNPADEEAAIEQTAIEAEVKMVRGLGQLDAPDTSMALSEWIAARDDLDLLLWFGREGDADSPMKYWVFRAAIEDDHPEAATDLATFEAALHTLGGQLQPAQNATVPHISRRSAER